MGLLDDAIQPVRGLIDYVGDPSNRNVVLPLAIGLMQGSRPGGSLASGLQQGLQNVGQFQQLQSAQDAERRKAEIAQQKLAMEQAYKQAQIGNLNSQADERGQKAEQANKTIEHTLAWVEQNRPQDLAVAQADPLTYFKEVVVPVTKGTESKPLSSVAKLRADYEAGLIDEPTYKAMTAKAMRDPNGITISPDGTVQIGGAAQGLTKPTRTAMEKDVLSMGDSLARLNQIEQSFDPKFTEWGTRASQAITALKEKAGFQPSQEDQQALGQYSQWKATSLSALNDYIKEITGAAMSEQEAVRIRQGFPDPGEGILDGDSPTQFQSKLKNSLKKTRMAIARRNYAQKNGLEWQDISLDQMPVLMRQRANEVEQILKQQGLEGDDLRQQIKERVSLEFGFR